MPKKKKCSCETKLKLKKVKKFSELLEGNGGNGFLDMFWDEGNKKAVNHHAGLTKKYEDKTYFINVAEPFIMKTTDFDDFQKMKRLLNKYKIGFSEKEEMKKTEITEN